MGDIERMLKECRLAAIPEETEARILLRELPERRRRWSRRYWAAVAAGLLCVIGLHAWSEWEAAPSPYASPVTARREMPPRDWEEADAELIALLGEAGHDYLVHVGVIRNGS